MLLLLSCLLQAEIVTDLVMQVWKSGFISPGLQGLQVLRLAILHDGNWLGVYIVKFL